MSHPTNETDLELIKHAVDNKLSGPVMKALGPVIAATGLAGVAGLATYFKSKSDLKAHQTDLAKSLQATYSMDKSFDKNPENFARLFGELSVMSPTVAKSPNLASKLIAQRMNTGFGLDDVHKLSVIESSGGINRAPRGPGAAATGAAASALGTLGLTFGPGLLPGMWEGAKETKRVIFGRDEKDRSKRKAGKKAAEYAKAHGPTKAGDPLEQELKRMMEKDAHDAGWDLRVSEECLGKMVSDRVTLYKEASGPIEYKTGAKLWGLLKENVKSGAGNIYTHLAYIAPALALGGGLGLVKLVHDRMQDNSLKAEADANFAHLMRTSAIAKGNPEVSRESYETLKMVAPILATRPGVLKSFIENQANTGMLPNYEQVKSIAETGNAVSRSTENKGFFSGVKDVLEFPRLLPGKGKKG